MTFMPEQPSEALSPADYQSRSSCGISVPKSSAWARLGLIAVLAIPACIRCESFLGTDDDQGQRQSELAISKKVSQILARTDLRVLCIDRAHASLGMTRYTPDNFEIGLELLDGSDPKNSLFGTPVAVEFSISSFADPVAHFDESSQAREMFEGARIEIFSNGISLGTAAIGADGKARVQIPAGAVGPFTVKFVP